MCSELINPTLLAAIIGAVIGGVFILFGVFIGVGIDIWRNKRRIKKLKRMINNELKFIKTQINNKINIIKKSLKKLESAHINLAESDHIINIGYQTYIPELYEHLLPEQKNCLHLIYDHINLAEKMYLSFEKDILNLSLGDSEKDSRNGQRIEPLIKSKIELIIKFHRQKLENAKNIYELVSEFIDEYLKGNIRDNFHIDNSE